MRCSALPLATKCRGSYKLTGGYGSEQSRVGQAFHEAAKAKVLGITFDKDSLRTRYGLTDDEMKSIDYGVYNITIRIPDGALVLADNKEMTALDGKLTGTPDLGIYHNLVVTVADWKSGWGDVEDPETNNQLLGYGILILETLKNEGKPDPVRIDLMIIQPKLNQVKAYTFTPEKLRARAEDIRRIIREAEEGGEFITGPWCNACFKNMQCPAFAGQIQILASMVAEPVPIAEHNLEVSLKKLLPFVKACATVGKKVEALAKAWVDRNGPLDLGDNQMYVRTVGEKQEVNPSEAFEILKGFFGEERVWIPYSISMDKVMELAVSTKRGLSTVVKNSLIEAGAITKKTAVTYRVVKGGSNGGAE